MLTLVAAVLLAAPAPAPAPGSSGGTASAAQPAPSDAAVRYDAAMALLLDGKLEEAAHAFDAVAGDPAAGPLADRARTLAEVSRALAARGRFVLAEPGTPAPAERRRQDRRGRAELAFFGTVYGIWTGVATGLLADSEDGRVYLALTLAGGAGGLTLALLPTRHAHMPEGRAQAIESAALWGSFNGGLVAALADAETKPAVAATLGAGLVSLGTAVALTRERSPSPGDVALTNSGGIWGLVTGGLTLALLDDPSDSTIQAVLLGGADAGLLAMALVARRVDMSRGRSLLIDAGGLLGTLGGIAIPAFADSDNAPLIGAAGLAGMVAGLSVATYLSRDWDEDESASAAHPGGAMAMPMVARLEGGGFSAGVAGRF